MVAHIDSLGHYIVEFKDKGENSAMASYLAEEVLKGV